MTRTSAALIPTGAHATYEHLQDVVADALERGTPVPCRTDPEPFTSDDRDERAQAADLWRPCPALRACRAYARAGRERWGVWGGRDRTGTPARPGDAPTVRRTRVKVAAAAQLRAQGLSYKAIGEQLGVSGQTVHVALTRAPTRSRTEQHRDQPDDRLDAIALLRARLAEDPQAMRVLLNTAGEGMYLALLKLTCALTAAQSDGHPDRYLEALAARVRADRDNPPSTQTKEPRP